MHAGLGHQCTQRRGHIHDRLHACVQGRCSDVCRQVGGDAMATRLGSFRSRHVHRWGCHPPGDRARASQPCAGGAMSSSGQTAISTGVGAPIRLETTRFRQVPRRVRSCSRATRLASRLAGPFVVPINVACGRAWRGGRTLGDGRCGPKPEPCARRCPPVCVPRHAWRRRGDDRWSMCAGTRLRHARGCVPPRWRDARPSPRGQCWAWPWRGSARLTRG